MKQFTFGQLVILGLVGYVGYRLGRHLEKGNSKIETTSTEDEQNFVTRMFNELTKKPNKTQKDKDNIGLLKVKLDQLKNQK